tara:strand:+ start:16263 stop:16625 length:363 start_codon:yes stop_codon:yes gene_type:complete
MPAKLNENTEVALPLRNIISMVAAASLATWAYFGVIERLNTLETSRELMNADLLKKSEQTTTDSEQYMLIEHLAGELEKLQTDIESGKAPFDQQQKLTLDFYERRITSLEESMEKLRNGG